MKANNMSKDAILGQSLVLALPQTAGLLQRHLLYSFVHTCIIQQRFQEYRVQCFKGFIGWGKYRPNSSIKSITQSGGTYGCTKDLEILIATGQISCEKMKMQNTCESRCTWGSNASNCTSTGGPGCTPAMMSRTNGPTVHYI